MKDLGAGHHPEPDQNPLPQLTPATAAKLLLSMTEGSEVNYLTFLTRACKTFPPETVRQYVEILEHRGIIAAFRNKRQQIILRFTSRKLMTPVRLAPEKKLAGTFRDPDDCLKEDAELFTEQFAAIVLRFKEYGQSGHLRQVGRTFRCGDYRRTSAVGYCVAECDCGNHVIVSRDDIAYERKRDCGCLNLKPRPRQQTAPKAPRSEVAKRLLGKSRKQNASGALKQAGQNFYLGVADRRGGRMPFCVAECQCGNHCVVSTEKLSSGVHHDCGCGIGGRKQGSGPQPPAPLAVSTPAPLVTVS